MNTKGPGHVSQQLAHERFLANRALLPRTQERPNYKVLMMKPEVAWDPVSCLQKGDLFPLSQSQVDGCA